MRPTPERLTSLGPSHAAELLRCGYRVAWDRDPSVGGAAPNVKALQGTIGHRLCERSALGLLGGPDAEWEARFDLAWREELERAAQRYPELGEPARWAGHNLQRALWRNKARDACDRVAYRRAAGGGRTEASGVEVPLSTGDGRLVGVADVVLRHGDDVEVRDLKSGRTLDDAGEVSEPYRIQLLLYGVMYEDSFGVWPTRLVIDPIVRDPIEVEPDRSEAIRYRRAVSDAMDAFDAAVDAGTMDALANPSRDTCRFCPHISRCRPFWGTANKGWDGTPRALGGTVTDVVPGTAVVAVSTGTIDYGSWTIGGIGDLDVAVGDFVEVVGFEWRPDRKLAVGGATEWRLASRPGRTPQGSG